MTESERNAFLPLVAPGGGFTAQGRMANDEVVDTLLDNAQASFETKDYKAAYDFSREVQMMVYRFELVRAGNYLSVETLFRIDTHYYKVQIPSDIENTHKRLRARIAIDHNEYPDIRTKAIKESQAELRELKAELKLWNKGETCFWYC